MGEPSNWRRATAALRAELQPLFEVGPGDRSAVPADNPEASEEDHTGQNEGGDFSHRDLIHPVTPS